MMARKKIDWSGGVTVGKHERFPAGSGTIPTPLTEAEAVGIMRANLTGPTCPSCGASLLPPVYPQSVGSCPLHDAAPDMLEALRDVATLLEGIAVGRPVVPTTDICEQAQRIARAAIERATKAGS